jgi:hypothetical protein
MYGGSTGQGGQISLRVGTSRRNITFARFSYAQVCQVRHHRLVYSYTPVSQNHGSWQLKEKHGLGFSERFKDGTGARYQMTGTFGPSGRASGTLEVLSHTRRYGTCDSGLIRWQAQH